MEETLTKNEIEIIFDRIKSSKKNINIKEYENKILKVTLKKYFPNIPKDEIDFIFNCYIYLLNYIYESLFESEDIFWKQMLSNNSQDLETIFLLLLPFLKNDKTNDIVSLNNLIYYEKKINIEELKNKELSKFAKDLKYTNKMITLINNQRKGELEINYKKIILTHLNLTKNTIRKINNRMMINWQNIWPMKYEKISRYENEFLLPKNNKYIENSLETIILIRDFILNHNLNTLQIEDEIELNKIIMRPNGLWIGNLYEQICNRFYLSVLSSKFLIYNYKINNKIIYGIEIINNILKSVFNIKEIDYSKKFYDYNEEKQLLSEINFKNYLNNIFSEDNIELEFILKIIIHLLNFSDYENINQNINLNKIRIEFIKDNEINNIEDNFINDYKNRNILINFMKNIEFKDFYNFIYNSIQNFKATPYGRLIFNNNRLDIKFIDNILNVKFIYNWAKSFSNIIENREFKSLGYHFEMNHKEITFKILSKLFRNNWFNIEGNLERSNITNINSADIHREITSLVDYKEYKLPLYLVFVFDDMIRNGVLSEFKVNTKLTDKTKQSSDKKTRMKERGEILKTIFKENKEWDESFYYWTNKKYNELEKYCITPKDKPNKYFDLLSNGRTFEWSTYFSNDWVTQIDFYTHFLNQQIMYVTGSTGQGKSTQVPKLTSYGTKAFLYKNDGNIIGTQPRTGPTRGNISWISRELGIPVLDYYDIPKYKEKQEIPTDNFYLQFKYQADKHVNDEKSLKLTMATDGTLLNEISNSITLKRKLINNNRTVFSNQNIYDVVMVDEAHEHNPNMDLILSLMRQTLYYNTEIRLLIISATMDDDEPLYRSYYSLIDDNHSYPYKTTSINEIFTGIKIDSNYFDRRFNISPPGGTTQYKVEEIYKPIDNLPDNLNDVSKITQLESYKLVKEIADKNPNGEILLFLNGQKEINEAVKELNKILPKKTIALPFYTKLNNKYKDMIQSIEKYISSLKIRKDEVHEKWGEEYYENNSVPNNSYERAVIIATNVAEASITIERLKFVVDNGFSKENKYEPLIGPSLQVDEISESSRIQRKGRVGRRGPGTAYFLYKKGDRENNPPKLKITQSDPISWMIPFIKNANKIDNENLDVIMTNNEDFHNKDFNVNNLRITSPIQIINISSQIDLLKNYFRNFNDFKPSNIFYQTTDEYKNFEMLIDYQGIYWIIHPLENKIKRNLFYEIIEFNDKKEKEIPKLVRKNIENIISLDKDIFINYGLIKTSNISSIISKIESELEVEKSLASTILYGFSLNILPEVIMTITLIKIFKADLTNLLGKKEVLKLQNMNKYNSDISPFIEISKMILKSSNNSILKDFNNYYNLFINKIEREAIKLKKIYLNKDRKNELKLEDLIYLKKLEQSKEWNNKNIIGKIVSKTKYFKNYFKNNGFKFSFNLDDNKLDLITEDFNELFVKCLVLRFNLKMSNNKILDDFEKLLKNLNNSCIFLENDNNKILFSIHSGIENNLYILKNNILIDNKEFKYSYKNIKIKNKEIINSIVNQNYLQTYYSISIFNNIRYVNLVSNLPIEWLIILNPIYFKVLFISNKNNISEIYYYKKIVNDKIYLIKQFWSNIDDSYENISNSIKNIEKKMR